MRFWPALVTLVLGGAMQACNTDETATLSPSGGEGSPLAAAVWGPETPRFNLEVILRGQGFGLVKFRQPNDAQAIIYLDTKVRDLAPGTEYLLQRAVDLTVDDVCTGSAWLTLGRGLQPQAIATDGTGAGEAQLFRDVSAFAPGTEFDIHFRVINAVTQAVVLQSGCYQFRISL
jgi:hypothetical protein